MSSKEQSKIEEKQQSKYDYLDLKYIFRYPFTVTSLKWATIMGGLFSAHAFIKKRTIKSAVEWGLWGTVLTVFPIWFFFMTKYSLYSHSIKKFETQQLALAEDSQLRKKLMQIKANSNAETQQILFKELTAQISKQYLKNKQLDFLLQGVTSDTFEYK